MVVQSTLLFLYSSVLSVCLGLSAASPAAATTAATAATAKPEEICAECAAAGWPSGTHTRTYLTYHWLCFYFFLPVSDSGFFVFSVGQDHGSAPAAEAAAGWGFKCQLQTLSLSPWWRCRRGPQTAWGWPPTSPRLGRICGWSAPENSWTILWWAFKKYESISVVYMHSEILHWINWKASFVSCCVISFC